MQPDTQPAPPSPAKLRLALRSRRIVLFAVVAAAILVVAITAIPLLVSSWSLVAHYECGPGATVATRQLWTPVVLVNSPYGGFGNGTGTFPASSGSWSENLTVSNGMAAAPSGLEEWSIAPSVRVLVAGPGANAVCTGFVATGKLVGGYIGALILSQGVTSDAGENTSFSQADPFGNDYSSVLFDNGYSERDFSFSSCGGGPAVLAAKASRISVEIPFTMDGSSYTASGTIDGAFNYTYSFPGDFGTWFIDDLNTGANAPGGGWAFSFAPCA